METSANHNPTPSTPSPAQGPFIADPRPQSPNPSPAEQVTERHPRAHLLADNPCAAILGERLKATYEEIAYADAVDSEVKRENANINGDTPMGMMLKFGSEGSKEFSLDYIIPSRFAKAHRNGDIHIHDLDFYATGTTTCTQIDIDALFDRGFHTGHGNLRTPNDILSYSALACIAIQSNQNDQHGGQSIPNFDYALSKGVAKTFIKEYKLAMFAAVEMISVDPALEEFSKVKEFVENLVGICEGVTGHRASLTMNPEYKAEETRALVTSGFSREEAERIQDYTFRTASRETEKKTHQAMEALVHNLNTMQSRAGSQVPFSSINYGTCTTAEGRMVTKNLLLATKEGLGDGETSIFPVQIFKVMDGVNYNIGDPNYDLFKLAMEVSAERLFPNFENLTMAAGFNRQYYKPGRPETEVATMGCRTRVMGNVFDPNKEIAYGRGNLSFTTINLPRLGIEAHGDIDAFFASLDEKLQLALDQLDERVSFQMAKRVKNFPMLMGQGVWEGSGELDSDDELGEILLHGSISVGFIGLAETLVALTGKHHGEDEEARALGLKIVGYMRSWLDERAKAAKRNYTLLATPAEGLSGRFVTMDRKKYGKIPGVTDREYYTNSFHVPVYCKTSVFEKVNVEAPYHALCNAGHISYIELDGEPSKNMEAYETCVRHMIDSGMGYCSINFPLDSDPVCGYRGVMRDGDRCPRCGRDENEAVGGKVVPFSRIRRITGYLVGTLSRFNSYKKAEVRDRVKHG